MFGVLKIGSSLFDTPAEGVERLKKFIAGFNGSLAFVVGAGRAYKSAIENYRSLKFPEGFLDQLGIELTHVNAMAIARAIEGVHCRTFKDVEKNWIRRPVTGGQVPGQSTDAVAAELADFLGADILIFVKDVGGIYTKDPKEESGARPIRKMEFGDLREFIPDSTKAGHYGVLDGQAIQIIMRSKIPTRVIGPDMDISKGTAIGSVIKE